MPIILDTDNIFEYLATLNYCTAADRDTSLIKFIPAKNFNLLITFADGRSLLVKQELHNHQGQSKGEFWSVWRMQKILDKFPGFANKISIFLPELLHFDADNSILIINYLTNYCDLYLYYTTEYNFSIEIARSIGELLATIHSQTFQRMEYADFFEDSSHPGLSYFASDIIHRFDRITPQAFRIVPQECLQFFKLYQRFPSLSQAIFDLGESITPSCLVHNDLKINNILLDVSWDQPESKVIRLIDWERANWGDPAFDLGCILGSYLEIWLAGLVISNTLSISESLKLATTPLDVIQPSLSILVKTYLDGFPAIMTTRPDYLDRVIQFTGLSLVKRVNITIEKDRIFGDRGIIMLQVGKQLLCNPQAGISTLFGTNFTQSTIN
jgi:Phosphotransferase enzyme family